MPPGSVSRRPLQLPHMPAEGQQEAVRHCSALQHGGSCVCLPHPLLGLSCDLALLQLSNGSVHLFLAALAILQQSLQGPDLVPLQTCKLIAITSSDRTAAPAVTQQGLQAAFASDQGLCQTTQDEVSFKWKSNAKHGVPGG